MNTNIFLNVQSDISYFSVICNLRLHGEFILIYKQFVYPHGKNYRKFVMINYLLLIRVLDCWQYNSEQTTKQIPITFPENFLSNAVFTFQITYYSNCNQLQRTELFSLNLLKKLLDYICIF